MAAVAWIIAGLVVAGILLGVLLEVVCAIRDAERFLGGDSRAADPAQEDR
jgi:hypothetical protein